MELSMCRARYLSTRLAWKLARLVSGLQPAVYRAQHAARFRETAARGSSRAAVPGSKRAMELIAHSFHRIGTFVTVLRFFNVCFSPTP